MGGASGISYSEIEARSRMLRRPLEPWQVEALSALDTAYLEVQAERSIE